MFSGISNYELQVMLFNATPSDAFISPFVF